MHIGIKAGPQSESKTNLEATKPEFCEVWFNAGEEARYDELFSYCESNHIAPALHFWGALPDGTWTNIAYPDTELIKSSMDMMKHTIDLAARYKSPYVNIHPGQQSRVTIDFSCEQLRLQCEPVALVQSEQLFIENATILEQYACDRGVVFTVETIPARVTNGWYDSPDRDHPLNIYELPSDVVIRWAAAGHAVANDFGHTAASVISDDANEVRSYLFAATRDMTAQTRLIHAGFIVPPYSGTDFHDTLLNPLFKTSKAIPNEKEMQMLLTSFSKRDDVYVLVEPASDHIGNYQALKNLVKTIEW